MLKFIYLLIVFFTLGCAHRPPQILNSIDSKQVLIVTAVSQKTQGHMSLWEFEQGHWNQIYKASVVLGRTGLAEQGQKQEGDGHTPSGIYPIERAFGYGESFKTKLPYIKATDSDVWVDDVHSPQYNQWVHGTPNAQSFEHMHGNDHLYQLGAVIEYNTKPIVPGKGSAIFMHIWRTYYKPTAGCVALSQRNLRRILKRLDPDKKPVIVLGDWDLIS